MRPKPDVDALFEDLKAFAKGCWSNLEIARRLAWICWTVRPTGELLRQFKDAHVVAIKSGSETEIVNCLAKLHESTKSFRKVRNEVR